MRILVEYADGYKRQRGKLARGAKNSTEITHKIFTPRVWGWQPLGRHWMRIITRTRCYGQYCVDSIRNLMNRDLAGFVWKTHHTSRYIQWISFSLPGISSLRSVHAVRLNFSTTGYIREFHYYGQSLTTPPTTAIRLWAVGGASPVTHFVCCVCVQRGFSTKIYKLEFNVDDESCMVVAMNYGAWLGFIWWNPFSVLPMTITDVALTRKLTKISKLKGRFWWTLSRGFSEYESNEYTWNLNSIISSSSLWIFSWIRDWTLHFDTLICDTNSNGCREHEFKYKKKLKNKQSSDWVRVGWDFLIFLTCLSRCSKINEFVLSKDLRMIESLLLFLIIIQKEIMTNILIRMTQNVRMKKRFIYVNKRYTKRWKLTVDLMNSNWERSSWH